MNAASLAGRLLSVRDKKSRSRLITANYLSIGIALAEELKDICVENWAVAPKTTRLASRILDEIVEQKQTTEMSAYANWAGGIAEMTFGRLDAAVSRLEKATAEFVKAKMELRSAQPQIASLVALAMLGRYDQIPVVGRRALKVLEKYGDDLSAGKVEINLSNVASRLGRHRQAERLGLSAHRRFKAVKARAWQAMAENGLAITYTELNNFRAAERFFRAGLRSAKATGAFVTEAETLASIGNLELFRGRYADALRSLELSRRLFDQLQMPHKTAVADLEIAEIYLELNLTAESEQLFSKAVDRLSKLKLRGEEARARLGLGVLEMRMEKYSGARTQLRKALTIYEREKNMSGRANAILSLAMLEQRKGRYKNAAKLAAEIAQLLRAVGSDRQRLMSEWVRADAEAGIGRKKAGLARLGKTLAEALRLEQSSVAVRSLLSIGEVQLESGDIFAAKAAYEKALQITEYLREPLVGDEFRLAFLGGRLDPFEKLAKIAILEGKTEEAFAYVERAKSRSLLEVARNGSRGNSSVAPEILELREKLNWSYSRLSSGSDIKRTQFEIRRLEKQLSTATRRTASLLQNQQRSNDRSTLPNLTKLKKDLGSGRALIEYVTQGGRISAFVVTQQKLSFFPDIATTRAVASALEDLRFQFESLRFGRESVKAFLPQLKMRADQTLSDLFKKLLAPLEGAIAKRDLVIVPSGVIHYVPFAALKRGVKYIIQDRTITTAPSASVWQTMIRQRTVDPVRPLLISYSDAMAPMVESEITAIAGLLKEPTVLSGDEATFANFERLVGKHDLVHIACHGQFRADNPRYSSLRIADGNITVGDISSKRMNGARVVLSACETGLNAVFPGEEIVGLARGFISAGVRSLLLSLWTVNDDATRRLMIDFYRNLQLGRPFETSLRLAQLKFIRDGEHPYYWSPFVPIG